ncbi:MAG: hypothetical protein JKY37_01170 [Nannocystaceae bacterium]|nr:hypothetical protein [Nannocystaceae bacterium]
MIAILAPIAPLPALAAVVCITVLLLIATLRIGLRSRVAEQRRPSVSPRGLVPRIRSWMGPCVALVTVTAIATPAAAAPTPKGKIKGKGGNLGVGFSLGDPMGASLKYFMHPNHAIQADFGWAPLHHGNGRIGADYLWHPGTFASNSTFDFLPYIGVGVGMMFWARRYCGRYYYHGRGYRYDGNRECGNGGAAMFIRAPVLGLGFHWKGAPLDTMLEGSWSPYLVLPDLAHGDVSFKFRYYF